MKKIVIRVLLLLFFISLNVSGDMGLRGVVHNGDGEPIGGAIVRLSSEENHNDTTDSEGEFEIIIATGISVHSSSSESICNHFNAILFRNHMTISLDAPVVEGIVTLYSAHGKCLVRQQLGSLASGNHQFLLPDCSPGLYFAKLSLDGTDYFIKCITAGGTALSVSGNTTSEKQSARVYNNIETDTLTTEKSGYKPEKTPVLISGKDSSLLIIMDRTKSPDISVSEMPDIDEMPDPLTMNDGTQVTTLAQWRLRRREMIRILEDYEYGHMPPPPGNVTAKVKTELTRVSDLADYRDLRLSFGPEKKCGFDMTLFTPRTTPDPDGFPVLIYVGFSTGRSSLSSASEAVKRGYAVAMLSYTQLGADSRSWESSAFFPSYPEYDWRDFSAWAWGISRAVDYLVTDSMIDKEKIMATGASRCGQPVLLAGAFDERIALSAPVAGGMAMRYSGREMGEGIGQGITEVVDQGTYWFGPLLEKFRNRTPKLPCDQHWLPALTAPRLFIMCNSYSDEYGRAYAAVQTFLGALPVYEFLDVPENLGHHYREGGHGFNGEDWDALLDFADQKLLGKSGTRKFNEIPPRDKTP